MLLFLEHKIIIFADDKLKIAKSTQEHNKLRNTHTNKLNWHGKLVECLREYRSRAVDCFFNDLERSDGGRAS